MKFLLDINIIINYTVGHSKFVYDTVKLKEDLIDDVAKEVLLIEYIHPYCSLN